MRENKARGAERQRTGKIYGLNLCEGLEFTQDGHEMPIIQKAVLAAAALVVEMREEIARRAAAVDLRARQTLKKL